jgi:hypothetical protein
MSKEPITFKEKAIVSGIYTVVGTLLTVASGYGLAYIGRFYSEAWWKIPTCCILMFAVIFGIAAVTTGWIYFCTQKVLDEE